MALSLTIDLKSLSSTRTERFAATEATEATEATTHVAAVSIEAASARRFPDTLADDDMVFEAVDYVYIC